MIIIVFIISLLASIGGSVSGIGGGVLIKPILDSMAIAGVSTVSFLSTATVFSMSAYSVLKSSIAKDSLVDFKTVTPLAIGAAIGGAVGKQIFAISHTLVSHENVVGSIQSICLFVLTLGTLVYTLNKAKIKTYTLKNVYLCCLVGFALGTTSSFLGIGGGPINLIVLFFLFSMHPKQAAQNSLYIILFSQTSSLLLTFATNTVPDFKMEWLIVMVVGGILGGAISYKISHKISENAVTNLFMILLLVILASCVWNVIQFSAI